MSIGTGIRGQLAMGAVFSLAIIGFAMVVAMVFLKVTAPPAAAGQGVTPQSEHQYAVITGGWSGSSGSTAYVTEAEEISYELRIGAIASDSTEEVSIAISKVGTATPDPSGVISVSPTTMSLTAADANSGHGITVTPTDNDTVDELPRVYEITHTFTSGDYADAGVGPIVLLVVVGDDEELCVIEGGNDDGLYLTEGSTARDSYTLRLCDKPSGSTYVSAIQKIEPVAHQYSGLDGLTNEDLLVQLDDESKHSPIEILTFTPQNYADPQTVYVELGTGAEDDFGIDKKAVIEHTITGTNNAVVGSNPIEFTMLDNDWMGVQIRNHGNAGTANGLREAGAIDLLLLEDGGQASYDVRLHSSPLMQSYSVDLRVRTPEGVSASPQVVSFDQTNWNQYQRVILRSHLGDSVSTGDREFTVGHRVSGSGWQELSEAQSGVVNLTVIDNDFPGVTFGSVDGNGRVVYYRAKLNVPPAPGKKVTLSGTVTNTEHGRVLGGGQLVFDASNWRSGLEFAVVRFDMNRTLTVQHSVSSADSKYHGISVDDVVIR